MIKQGVVLDYTNKGQVEGFTRLANAVAVYSNNGRNEIQVRQEVSALLRGEVDQNSQLASMLQKTVDGPLKDQVEKWKQSGTLVEELGKHLAGFGPAAKDMEGTWGAVKSSLETAVNVMLRSGFSEVVKDLVGWLGVMNEYLKSHAEEIGNRIKQGWLAVKGIMESVFAVLKTDFFRDTAELIGFIGRGLGLLATSVLPPVIQRFSSMFDTIYNGGKAAISVLMVMGNAMLGNWSGVLESGKVFSDGIAGMVSGIKKTFASGFGDDIATRAAKFLDLDGLTKKVDEAAAIPKIDPQEDQKQLKEVLKAHKQHLEERLALYKEHNERYLKQEEAKYKLLLSMEEQNSKFIKEGIDSLDRQINTFAATWKKTYDTIIGIETARNQARDAASNAALSDFEREQQAIQGLIDRQRKLSDISDPTAQLKEADAIAQGWNNIADAVNTDINKVILVERHISDLKTSVRDLGTDHMQSLVDQKNKMSELWYDAQTRANDYQGTLDLIKKGLDALNNRTIKIGFEITGLDQVQGLIDLNNKATGVGTGAVNAPSWYNTGSASTPKADTSSINTSTVAHYGANLDKYFASSPNISPGTFMNNTLPSYAVGTPYVPQTGLALIHQGERIIPADQNKPGYGGITIAGDIVIHAGTTSDPKALARQIYSELEQLGTRVRR
jgi:hypothetical protein